MVSHGQLAAVFLALAAAMPVFAGEPVLVYTLARQGASLVSAQQVEEALRALVSAEGLTPLDPAEVELKLYGHPGAGGQCGVQEACIRDAARKLGAAAVLFGTVVTRGASITAKLARMDVAGGPVARAEAKGLPDDPFALEAALAPVVATLLAKSKVKATMAAAPPAPEAIPPLPTLPLVAPAETVPAAGGAGAAPAVLPSPSAGPAAPAPHAGAPTSPGPAAPAAAPALAVPAPEAPLAAPAVSPESPPLPPRAVPAAAPEPRKDEAPSHSVPATVIAAAPPHAAAAPSVPAAAPASSAAAVAPAIAAVDAPPGPAAARIISATDAGAALATAPGPPTAPAPAASAGRSPAYLYGGAIAAGVGALAFIVGGVFGASSSSARDRLEQDLAAFPGGLIPNDDAVKRDIRTRLDEIQSDAIVANVLMIGGGLLAGAGGAFVAIELGAERGLLAVRGAF